MASRKELTNGKYIDDQMGNGVPEGGATGQVLTKASNDDYDLVWTTGSGGGGNVPDVTSITASSPLTGGTITTTGTIGISKATTSVDGYLSSIDWNNFNSKEPAISSGTTSQYWRGDKTWQAFPNIPAAQIQSDWNQTNNTLLDYIKNKPTIPTVGTWGALNYPTWTTGTPFIKMTADGTFSLDTDTYYLASNPSGFTNNTGTVTSVAALTLGTSGTDLSSSVATGTTTPVITLNVPDASATARGVVTTEAQTLAGAKTFSTAPILSSLTASQILATDASKNVQSLTTATYPSLTELSYVKGVKSALQTQLGAKQDLLLSAYSFRANNTASAANATDFTFKEVASQTLSSGITWNGTPPSGTQTHQYRWNQIGNLVTFYATLLYTVAGTNNSQLILALPTDCPTPYRPSSLQAANDMLYYGSANMSISRNTVITTNRPCMLRRNTANTGFEIIVTAASSTMVYVSITIQYFTN